MNCKLPVSKRQVHVLTVEEGQSDRHRVTRGELTSRPKIRLVGNWLQGAGISAGDHVIAEVHPSYIILRRLK